MNSCILMATIVRKPELRHTPDGVPVTDMLVEFEGTKPEERSTLLVVGWRNLAEEMAQNYSEGDRVIIEGRLSMKTVDHPKGFKEKKAELVASRIYHIEGMAVSTAPSVKAAFEGNRPTAATVRHSKAPAPTQTQSDRFSELEAETIGTPQEPVSTVAEGDLDDIPF